MLLDTTSLARKNVFILTVILVLTLTNYQVAKGVQKVLLTILPSASYQLTLVIPWLALCALPYLVFQDMSRFKADLQLNFRKIRTTILEVLLLSSLVLIGLILFVALGFSKYFHSVQYPLIFFIATPIIEEVLFRGWIFSRLKSIQLFPVVGSAALFGVHHLQYFSYIPTSFAIFQMSYTFLLGLLFARIRLKTESLYIPILLHMLINWVAVSF